MADNGTVPSTRRRVSTRGRKSRPKAKAYKGGEYLFTVIVAGHPVQVFSIKRFPKNAVHIGEYDPNTSEIFIRQDLPSPQAEADTMAHEVVHAISNVALSAEDRLSERQVNALATTLIDILARNPELKEYLLARL